MTRFYFRVLTALAVCLPALLYSQEKPDTVKTKPDTTKVEHIIEDIKNSEVSKKLLKTITKKQPKPGKTIRSEDVFKPWEGKMIRRIIIRRVGFEKSITDTTRNIKNTITKIGNKLHSASKERVIRENMFIREHKPLNPYK